MIFNKQTAILKNINQMRLPNKISSLNILDWCKKHKDSI